MSIPIFIDANVPMYAAGRPHPLKEPSAAVLEFIALQPERFFTSAEVLQELMYRYLSLRRWAQGREIFLRFA